MQRIVKVQSKLHNYFSRFKNKWYRLLHRVIYLIESHNILLTQLSHLLLLVDPKPLFFVFSVCYSAENQWL